MGIGDRDYYRNKHNSSNANRIINTNKKRTFSIKQKAILSFILLSMSFFIDFEYSSLLQIVLGIITVFYVYKYLNYNYYYKMKSIGRTSEKYFSKLLLIIGILLLLNYTSYLGYHDINTDSMLNFIKNGISKNSDFRISTNSLNIGDTSTSYKNIDICVDRYAFEDHIKRILGSQTDYGGYYLNGEPVYKTTPVTNDVIAPEGSKFLLAYITVENVGDVVSDSHTVLVNRHDIRYPEASPNDYPYLTYTGSRIDVMSENNGFGPDHDILNYTPTMGDYGAKYPNVKEEGWIMFEVPANIDMSKTTITIQGLTWRFE